MLLKDAEYAYFPEKAIRLLFWFILFSFFNIPAQTILNNFGSLETIKTYHGYKKIVLLDFDNDGYDDIFLCGNNQKHFVLHKNLPDSTFSGPIKKFFFYPIDDIKWLTKSDKGDDYYIFISRNKRLVGLASFTKNYALQLLNTKEFNSYPSVIKIVDLNNDGINEALIFGNNFDGLSIVRNKSYKLFTTKLIDQMVVKDLDLIDFNQDNFNDIVLIDMLDNSLKFYENYAADKINFNREVEFRDPIFNVKNIDFNYDDFNDLMVGKEGGLEILFGDSVYAFYKNKIINFDYTPESFELADLNLDIDDELILLDRVNNQVVVSFANSSKSNVNKYFLKGLSDFKVLADSSGKKLVELSKFGELFILSNKNLKGKDFSFSIGGKPTIMKIINNGKSKIFNIAVYDQYDKNINLLRLDSLGNFNKNNKVHLFNPVSDFIISKKKQIIAFQKDSRLLELIGDIQNYKDNNHSFVYSSKPIQKIKFRNDSFFAALELENGNLYQQNFLYKENKFVANELLQIDSMVIESEFNKTKGILYWKQTKGKLGLYKFEDNKTRNIIEIDVKDSLSVNVKFINNINNYPLSTIIQYDGNAFIYSIKNKKINKYEIKDAEITNYKIKNNEVQFLFNKQTNQTNLFYLSRKKNKLIELILNTKKNEFVKAKETIIKNVDDFYVDIIFGKMYFVYTNFKNYSISFRVME